MYYNFENGVFRAPQQNHFHGCTTVHTKCLLLLISAIAPRRFCDFANQLGGIAWICKSSDFVSEVLRFQNSLFRGALNTRLSEMQYLCADLLDFIWIYNTSDAKTAKLIIKRAQQNFGGVGQPNSSGLLLVFPGSNGVKPFWELRIVVFVLEVLQI